MAFQLSVVEPVVVPYTVMIGFGLPVRVAPYAQLHAQHIPNNRNERTFAVPEIPQTPNRAILTGAFASFQRILSQSQRTIYTEVLFSIDGVLVDPTNQLAPGATITVAIPGGSVQTSNGTVSYLIDPEQFFIQPQKRYLMVLSYHSDGAFYTLTKNWELSNGIVKPNSKLEQSRAAKGKAALAGIAESQLAASLQTMLAATATY